MTKYKLKILAPAQTELEEITQVYMGLAGAESAKKLVDKIFDALEH